MWLYEPYETFHLAQNSRLKSNSVRGYDLKVLWKSATKRFFVIIFDIYYAALKIVTYVMS